MAKSKYYWLKLQKDFFHRHDIRIIEAMPNGKDYILFYLKLLVESVSHDGELRFSETIPYSDEMLATVTDTNIDIVRSALKIFESLNMIEVLDDQTIFMAEVEKMIGSASQDGNSLESHRLRQQKYRDRKRLESSQCCHGDVIRDGEIEKEIEKESDLEIETEKKSRKAPVYYPNDEALNEAFSDYVSMRKKIKAPMTDRAIELAMKKLEKMGDADEQIQILNQSIMNSWKGLFPLKESKKDESSGSIFDSWMDA